MSGLPQSHSPYLPHSLLAFPPAVFCAPYLLTCLPLCFLLRYRWDLRRDILAPEAAASRVTSPSRRGSGLPAVPVRFESAEQYVRTFRCGVLSPSLTSTLPMLLMLVPLY